MTRSRTNVTLLIALLVVVVITAMTRVDYQRSNIEILPDMKYTPARMAYSTNSVFANGRTLQPPVDGTIARGQLPLHFESTKEDALRAGEELKNPYGQTEKQPALLHESIRRGGETYRVFCISCHGPGGAGDGPVSKRGFPPPPSLLTGNSLQMKDGQLFHILSYGQGNMSDLAAQLSRRQRWDVINYLRSIQPRGGTQHDQQTVADEGSENQGQESAKVNEGQDQAIEEKP